MTTVTLWLLVVIGGQGYREYSTTNVLDRFADAGECQRVLHIIAETKQGWRVDMRCIQARVVRTAPQP